MLINKILGCHDPEFHWVARNIIAELGIIFCHALPGCVLDEQCRGACVCEVGSSPVHVCHRISCFGFVDSWSDEASESRQWTLMIAITMHIWECSCIMTFLSHVNIMNYTFADNSFKETICSLASSNSCHVSFPAFLMTFSTPSLSCRVVLDCHLRLRGYACCSRLCMRQFNFS